MFSLMNNTYLLRKGDPMGDRFAKIAQEKEMLSQDYSKLKKSNVLNI